MVGSCLAALGVLAGVGPALGGTTEVLYNTVMSQVVVNGGLDTANPGTSCIVVGTQVSSACPASRVAIPNNNKQLLAAALQAKATGGRVWLYYAIQSDEKPKFHCPGQVLTPCAVISISLDP